MVALWNAFYFVIALGILVTIHEFGHFWVARKLGVKVLTFSVGFGKPVWQRRAKDGVNYIIAAVPLGGYVKMLDEREGEVEPSLLPYAFNSKSVWARMAIVLAGPVANFVLAIVLYWWMFVIGIVGYSTQMGQIATDSIAGKAGLVENDVILQVDNTPVFLMQDVVKAVASRLGEKSSLTLLVETAETAGSQRQRRLSLPLSSWQVDSSQPDILGSLGIKHKLENAVNHPIIDNIEADSPAAKSPLRQNDQVLSVENKPINQWRELAQIIRANPDKETLWKINRFGEPMEISVVIGSREQQGSLTGYLGVRPRSYLSKREYDPFKSLELAVAETGKMIHLSVHLFAKLITGDISTKSLSGPISIAEGAGRSAGAGLVYFISFIAMISVNLGFINLLPIPLLDGGHLLYFMIEAIKGKPLSMKTQDFGLQVGMLMVFALMAIAIFNDLSRL